MPLNLLSTSPEAYHILFTLHLFENAFETKSYGFEHIRIEDSGISEVIIKSCFRLYQQAAIKAISEKLQAAAENLKGGSADTVKQRVEMWVSSLNLPSDGSNLLSRSVSVAGGERKKKRLKKL